jgi:hypothetical protein
MLDHILFLNRWPQYRDSERWDNELARPEAIIPHDQYSVTYLCDAPGRLGIPQGAEQVYLVEDFAQIDGVLAGIDTIIAALGKPHYVMAFSEYLLDLAATIRQRYDIPGATPTDIDRFRDKRIMKKVLAKSGVRVPEWRPCQSVEQVLSDAADLGFPLIFKPARGASSQGVHRVESADELRILCARTDLAEYVIEQYITGDIMHADGVVDRHGRCRFMSVSRYVSNCLAFENGEPFGSVLQTDSGVLSKCRDFALRCLSALRLNASAFHLEFFDNCHELVFLEIGARVPGADVPNVIHDVYGVNLFQLWVEDILGDSAQLTPVSTTNGGGWLMIPRPTPLPQTVISSTSLVGTIPFLYRELIPQAGAILEHTPGSYATLQGGRFLFRGGNQDDILEAMTTALAKYSLTTIPATPSR